MRRALLLVTMVAGCTGGDGEGSPSGPTMPGGEDCRTLRWWADADGDGAGASSAPVEACAAPPGYVDNAADCDDSDSDRFPDNPEVCDGRDQDCTGTADDGLPFVWYWADADADGFGDRSSTAVTRCDGAPDSMVPDTGDCDDTRADVFPGNPEVCDGVDQDCSGVADDGLVFADWRPDADGDGYGDDQATPISACSAPPGQVDVGGDCDDMAASQNPGVPEICDGVDQDCTGAADDGLVFRDWWPDVDADGYGSDDVLPVSSCSAVAGRVDVSGDCDDGDPTRFPWNPEQCDDIDQDCDAIADDGLPFVEYWVDADLDGFGDDSVPTVSACSAPAGRVPTAGDCDDVDPTVAPNRPELCDGIDQDCDLEADDGLAWVDYLVDRDGDGFGGVTPVSTCDGPPPDAAGIGGDCFDFDDTVFPGSPEVCDGRDQDCNGDADDGLVFVTYYTDADLDGFGNSSRPVPSCDGQPPGTAVWEGDCNDLQPLIHPYADAVCDNFTDTDCDGVQDEYWAHLLGSLQAAIDAAPDGGRVCVPAGTWDRADIVSKGITVTGMPGAVVDANGADSALYLAHNNQIEIEDLVITGADEHAVFVDDAWPTLRNLEIADNACTGCDGIGVYLYYGSATFEDVSLTRNVGDSVLRGNVGWVEGHDLSFIDNTVTGHVATTTTSTWYITDVNFEGNVAAGVLSMDFSLQDISRLTIRDNTVSDTLIVSLLGDAHLRNLLIIDNWTSYGNVFYADSPMTIEHATVAGNYFDTSAISWEGLVMEVRDYVTLTNSIIADQSWTNPPGEVFQVNAGGHLSSSYSDYWNTGATAPVNVGSSGNTAVTPSFSGADYRLSSWSSLVDAGQPGTYDLDGSAADLGAYGGSEAIP